MEGNGNGLAQCVTNIFQNLFTQGTIFFYPLIWLLINPLLNDLFINIARITNFECYYQVCYGRVLIY